MRRFIAFHDYAVPHDPAAAEKVRTHLEYLAVRFSGKSPADL